MTIETVYNLRDNENIVNFTNESGAIDFSAATRMVLRFEGLAIEADTDVDAALIDYSIGSGDVQFDLGGLSVPAGEYPVSLIVYDASHPLGQVLVHAEKNELYFNFIDKL